MMSVSRSLPAVALSVALVFNAVGIVNSDVSMVPAHAAPVGAASLPGTAPGQGVQQRLPRTVDYATFMRSEILLGSFFTSDADHTDRLYLSTDGLNFDELGVAYQDKFPNDPNSDVSTQGRIHHTLGDPSVIYHNGYFWMLSGMQRHDGRFWPMIGVSLDGKKWAYPEGMHFNGKKYPGIALNPPPAYGTDTVAPEWFRDSRGNISILFSAGYFGLFHGRPYQDRMVPYVVPVHELACSGFSTYDSRLPLITFRPGVAYKLPLSDKLPSSDRIDGAAFYDDDGSYYLTIKRDGAYNEIWRNSSFANRNGWQLVNRAAVVGQEGPSLTKLGGQYLLYTDKLPTWGPDKSRGTFVTTAASPRGPWKGTRRIITRSTSGRVIANRHGTVIRVTDTQAKRKLYTLYTGRPAPAIFGGGFLDWLLGRQF